MTTGLVLAGLLLAATGTACAQGTTTTDSTLPAAGRPVARISSTSWDTESSRDRVGEAERVFRLLDINATMRIADVGAGAGYYTTRLARRLGPGAAIYAQDISQSVLDALGDRIARDRLEGVTLVLGTPGDPKLPAASIDLALLSHMYHEIAQPYEFLFNLHRALAPGGRVAVIDSDKPTQSHGTPPALLRCEMAAMGYRELSFDQLAPASGYLAVFIAPDSLPPASTVRACTT
jgi:SAM-dependent methyltransferase